MRTRALLGALIALSLTVTACSPGEELTEQILEGQDGVDDVEIDEDTGEVTVESEDGSFTVGGGEIPSDWPVDVPSGGNVVAVGQDASGGSLSMDFPGADYDELVAFYDNWTTSSGFEVTQRIETTDPKGNGWTLQNGDDSYTISLNDGGESVFLLIFVIEG